MKLIEAGDLLIETTPKGPEEHHVLEVLEDTVLIQNNKTEERTYLELRDIVPTAKPGVWRG